MPGRKDWHCHGLACVAELGRRTLCVASIVLAFPLLLAHLYQQQIPNAALPRGGSIVL